MSPLPDDQALLAWLDENPARATKRDIAKAFNIKGSAERVALKEQIARLKADGTFPQKPKREKAEGWPPVTLLQIARIDGDGAIWAKAVEQHLQNLAPIEISLADKMPALAEGDRILARIGKGKTPTARIIRRLADTPQKLLGIYREGEAGGRLVPVDKKERNEWMIAKKDAAGARDGELVEAEQSAPRGRLGLAQARITARLGDPLAPRSISLIAIHEHGIPVDFSPKSLEEVENCQLPDIARQDLRDLPLVTIDPADARDHDDAIAALPDPDKSNPGGHILWVAIADVAAYVREESALDRDARKRGNSAYFPDRVVPMLPDRLSGDLCSLHEGVERPCIAVEITLDAQGNKKKHRFHRGLMRSHASLSYAQAQAAADGQPDDQTEPLLDGVIKPLWAVYRALQMAREQRQPLDLDLPERKVVLDAAGQVMSVNFRDRLDAHRLVEEAMVLANVCAAQTLEKKNTPLLYRVHEEPNPDKLEALREQVETVGLSLAKGQVLQTRQLNNLLRQARESEAAEMVNISVLRAMTQAYYSPENFAHFGLALRSYAHFTSPIRRYADLIVHRALIRAMRFGEDGLSDAAAEGLAETAEHISQSERRAMLAERDTTDRYLAAFLAERQGNEFAGAISGVTRFGVFVKLDETGADGLIPISSLGDDYWRFDAQSNSLSSSRTRKIIQPGMRVMARLLEVTPISGGLVFELVSLEGKNFAGSKRSGKFPSKGSPKRKEGQARAKRRKLKKVAKRR